MRAVSVIFYAPPSGDLFRGFLAMNLAQSKTFYPNGYPAEALSSACPTPFFAVRDRLPHHSWRDMPTLGFLVWFYVPFPFPIPTFSYCGGCIASPLFLPKSNTVTAYRTPPLLLPPADPVLRFSLGVTVCLWLVLIRVEGTLSLARTTLFSFFSDTTVGVHCNFSLTPEQGWWNWGGLELGVKQCLGTAIKAPALVTQLNHVRGTGTRQYHKFTIEKDPGGRQYGP